MTIFAPSDVRSITVPGGCGQPHEAGDLADGSRFTVDCAACEPAIAAMRTGWAHSPDGVALTPDELAVVEQERDKADRERNKTWGNPAGLTAAFADALKGVGAAPAQPSLLEQLAAMSPEERRVLGEMLRGDEAPSEQAPAAPATQQPVDQSTRRGPGRPRKTPPPAV